MLNTGEKLVRFNPAELTYIEANRVYCILHMSDGVTRYEAHFPMGKIKELLPAEDFVQISRSNVVNVWHICSKMGLTLRVDGCTHPLYISDSYAHCLDDRFVVIGLKRQ